MEEDLIAKKKPYLRHLKTSDDLVTPYEAVRAGFVALALERNRRATPFVAQARALKVAVSESTTPLELITIDGIQSALLTAAGISDKAAGHLQAQDKAEAIQGLIKNFLEPAGANFVEELVFRFLLTRGDTLGGSMRNVGGVLAQRKVTRSIIATLKLAGKSYRWQDSDKKIWSPMPVNDADIEIAVRGLSWQEGEKNRTLIYNLTVPFLKRNIDLCLFEGNEQTKKTTLQNLPENFLALGELKGGIDPAGADEHWKTARAPLGEIQKAFSSRNLSPKIFFIGASIAKRMATEIWKDLESDNLANVANLMDEDQVASISNWLCAL
jgi:hypothetical protein